MELSEAQKLAVETVGRNICVSAGAGSGKTRVLVERFLHLVMRHQISPARILAITFTEKAANEMKRRIVGRLREERLEEARREIEKASIGTIHSFAARLLREHPLEAGVDPHFVIFEAEEAALLKERVLDEIIETQAGDSEVFNLLRIYGERSVREGILDACQRSRNSEKPFAEMLARRTPADEKLSEDDIENFHREEKSLPLREVFVRLALQFEAAYEAAKREEGALDFDDLQIRAVRLLGAPTAASRALRKIYQEKFCEILVDEFQDTNRLQDRLVELVRSKSNLFVVGDLKQSIYGFRGTQVGIFIEKEKAFGESPDGARIALTENYRARPRLIDFVNRFFEILWKEDAIPFERLRAIRPEEGSGPRVERLRLERTGEETLDDLRIREARTLAAHIRSLVEKGGFRYRNIACLFEALTQPHFYEQEFRRAEIPYFVVSNRGFYSQPEIRDVVSFLQALENPKRDVPLAAALRSPLFQISDETLFWLARRAKQEKRETPLAEGVREFESIPEISGPEKEKLLFFQETLGQFLAEKERIRLSELVEKILRVTDYDLYVLKLRQGERRFANLRKLVEIARERESKEPLHLGDFIRAVQGLETREVRESQAQVEAEEGDAVKLMTIHMAKGLEFPVVILPDLGRGEKQEGGNFLLSEEEGLGIRVRNETTFKFEETLTFSRNKKHRDRTRSEESKRLLYVAMTRAQERLVLSGPASEKEPKDSFHEMPKWSDWVDRILGEGEWEVKNLSERAAEPFPFERRKALAEHPRIRSRLAGRSPFRLRETPQEIDSLLENLVPPEKAGYQRMDLPVSAFLLFAKDPEAYFEVYELGAPGSRAALEIKKEVVDGGDGEISSAEFGTRAHKILEEVWRRGPTTEAEPLLRRLTLDLSEKERNEMSEIVFRFLKSREAREILQSPALYPELPFVLRLPYGLIHGTLDLIYQNPEGEWVILDYKTSAADQENFVLRGEAYRIQLELYALAVWRILGRAPVEARIHFLRPGLTHRIPFLPADFEELLKKFTGLQKKILESRDTFLDRSL